MLQIFLTKWTDGKADGFSYCRSTQYICPASRPGFWLSRPVPDFGCPGPSRPLARFLACPVVPLSRDNDGTSFPLSRKVALSRPVGNATMDAPSRTPMVSKEACRFGALRLSLNWSKYEKPFENRHFQKKIFNFEGFLGFFNSGSILAQTAINFICRKQF